VEVKSPRVAVAVENSSTSFALVEVQPLFGLRNVTRQFNLFILKYIDMRMAHIRVPMKLPQTTRLESDKGRRNSFADREVGRVDLVESAAISRNGFRVMLERLIDKGVVAGGGTLRRNGAVANGALLDVWVRLGNIVKYGFWDAKVLGEDILGSVREPVVNVEGDTKIISLAYGAYMNFVSFLVVALPCVVELGVIKDQQKLVLVFETLDRMGSALREVPDITVVKCFLLVDAVLIDNGDED